MPDFVLATVRERIARGPASTIVIALVDSSGVRYFSLGRVTRAPDAPLADSTTIFEIGSITKTFTAVLLADMVCRGEVQYDDPVARYLPDSVRVPERSGRRITLRHLVAHRSGLARGVRDQDVRDRAIPWAETVARLYTHLPTDSLAFAPGTRFLYSNVGYALLGHVLERRGGQPYEDLIRSRLVGPLRLDDTGARLTPTQQARVAQGYDVRGEPRHAGYPLFVGAAALHSSARDLARFIQAQLGLLPTQLDSALALTRFREAEADRPDVSMTLGWFQLTENGRSVYWSAGATGGYRTFVAFDLQRRRGVVLLSNSQEEIAPLARPLMDVRMSRFQSSAP
jgi:CubicO group peptidase (beta-lactamase class C family)